MKVKMNETKTQEYKQKTKYKYWNLKMYIGCHLIDGAFSIGTDKIHLRSVARLIHNNNSNNNNRFLLLLLRKTIRMCWYNSNMVSLDGEHPCNKEDPMHPKNPLMTTKSNFPQGFTYHLHYLLLLLLLLLLSLRKAIHICWYSSNVASLDDGHPCNKKKTQWILGILQWEPNQVLRKGSHIIFATWSYFMISLLCID